MDPTINTNNSNPEEWSRHNKKIQKKLKCSSWDLVRLAITGTAGWVKHNFYVYIYVQKADYN